MAFAAPSRTASNVFRPGHRLLSRLTHPLFERSCSSFVNYGVVFSSLSAENANIFFSSRQQPHQQFRPTSSIGYSSTLSKSTSSFAPPTYSALRNNVKIPFENEDAGQQREGLRRPYISPYSQFFNNIDAGRTSLGTTKEMEQRVFEIQEQRLQCGIPESELRFRTNSYGRFALPPYVSPGEHRVTVKVALKAIPFENDQEKEIFLEIVGSRFNPKKGDLQLSSEKFASRIENKRYLVDMIEKIVLNARKLAKEFDAGDGKAKADAR